MSQQSLVVDEIGLWWTICTLTKQTSRPFHHKSYLNIKV